MLERIRSFFRGGKEKVLRQEYECLLRRQAEIAKEKKQLSSGRALGPEHMLLELEKELAVSRDRCEYLEHVLGIRSIDEEVKEDLSLLAKEELAGKNAKR